MRQTARVSVAALGLALAWSGTALAQSEGVTPSTILLGTTTPLTGPVGPPCKPISDGAVAWFKSVNAKGGVNGRKIENIVLDDAYKAPEALANGRELASKPVFAFFGGCGTLQPPVLMPIARQNGLLYLFPFAGNPELRTAKYVYNLFPMYDPQFSGAITAALKQRGPGSVFAVVPEVAGVVETIDAIKRSTEAAGGRYLGAERITQQESDYTPLVLKIKSLNPDYVVVHTTAPGSARIVKAMAAQDAYPKKAILGAITASSPAFLQSVPGLVDGKLLTVLPVVPPSNERAKPCLDAFKEHAPDLLPDVFSLWGCATAQAFVAAVQDTPEPLTRERLAKTLEGWKDRQVSTLLPPLSFNTPDHLGYKEMFLAKTEGNLPVLETQLTLP